MLASLRRGFRKEARKENTTALGLARMGEVRFVVYAAPKGWKRSTGPVIGPPPGGSQAGGWGCSWLLLSWPTWPSCGPNVPAAALRGGFAVDCERPGIRVLERDSPSSAVRRRLAGWRAGGPRCPLDPSGNFKPVPRIPAQSSSMGRVEPRIYAQPGCSKEVETRRSIRLPGPPASGADKPLSPLV
jgi:hypothetical protein